MKDNGFFHYNLEKHRLELITKDDLSENLAEASWNQRFIAESYIVVIMCAEFSRTTQRYGQRGRRYVFIEVGHCAQNVHLEVVALSLVSVPIGAFDDDKIKTILNIPKNIEPLYIIPIGYP